MLSLFRPSILMIVGLILGMMVACLTGCHATYSGGVDVGRANGDRLTSQVETVKAEFKRMGGKK